MRAKRLSRDAMKISGEITIERNTIEGICTVEAHLNPKRLLKYCPVRLSFALTT